MGTTCSIGSSSTVIHTQQEDVIRWRGHVLYEDDMDESHHQRELSAEIQAMYTSQECRVTLTILHFNDVYNIAPRDHEPVGGAARFASVVNSFQNEKPLTFFSGDALNPSIISSVTRGKHMVPILNAMKVNTAVYGNHDFDFGVDELEDIVRNTNFPWMISNVIDNYTGQPLADGLVTRMVVSHGKKIGLMGLVEEEWLVTLATIDRQNLTYLDFVKQGRKLAKELKEQGAEFVVALTHMRMPHDIELADSVEGIDLILGGHDHDYEVIQRNGKYIVKSGSDFMSLSKLEVIFDSYNPTRVNVDKIDVTSAFPEDQEVKEIVNHYHKIVSQESAIKLGTIDVDLDARFSTIRTQETNLGNFVADIMLATTNSDIALLNSGTFRSDTIHSKGDFAKKDLMNLLPMLDSLVVLQVTGVQLWQALENGVSQYPKKEGRFPQVGGMTFCFDPEANPGCRVDPYSIKVGEEPISPSMLYRLCTKEYIAQGKDGYDIFRICKHLSSAEEGPVLPTVIQNHFLSVHIVQGLKPCRSGHRQSLISLNSRHSLLRQSSVDIAERGQCTIAPKIEGRITHIPQEQRPLLSEHQSQFLQAYKEEQLINNNNELVYYIAKDTHILPTCISEVVVSRDTLYLSTDEEEEEAVDTGITSPSSSFVTIYDEEEMNCMWKAIQQDDIDKVKHLHFVQHVNVHFSYKATSALHVAVGNNAIHVAKYLLEEAKIDPDIQEDKEKNTALMEAVTTGNLTMVKLLLQNGASTEVINQDGKTALDFLPEDASSHLIRSCLNQQGSKFDNVQTVL